MAAGADSAYRARAAFDRRTLLRGLAAAAALPLLPGCTGGDSDADASGDASARAALSVRISEPAFLDPFGVSDVAGMQVALQLFDPLTRVDFTEGRAVGLAASSYDVSEDAQTFTFHLVEGRTFHNGDPVTAHDFKRAWERLVSPSSATALEHGVSPVAHHLALVEGYEALASSKATSLSGVTCPDDRTLVVHLSVPYADWALVAAHPALAPVPAAAEQDPKAFAVHPIGSGPFQMAADWEAGHTIELKRFEDYGGGVPAVETVRFAVGDVSSSYRDFEAENLDVCDVPVNQVSAARKALGVSEDGYTVAAEGRFLGGVEPTVYVLVCNTAEPPFDNVDFRRGISLAIDRESLCDKVFGGTRTPAASVVAACIPSYEPQGWKYCDYDADGAKQYLEKAYPADEEGKRDVSVKLLCSKGGVHAKVLESVVEDLAAVGVGAEVETVEWDELIERYRSGDFMCGRMSWTPDYATPDNILFPLFHSNEDVGDNYARYANADVDAALDEARGLVAQPKRAARWADAEKLIAEDCPVIPLAFGMHAVAVSERVDSLTVDPFSVPHLVEAALA